MTSSLRPGASTLLVDESLANAAYGIVVSECGASADEREAFVHYATTANAIAMPLEWRFMGDLGFGGKLHVNASPTAPLRVSCYPEDSTPEREAMIAAANERLAGLFAGEH